MLRRVSAGVGLLGLIFLAACGMLAPIFGPDYQTTDSHVDQGKDQGFLRFLNSTHDHRIYVDGQLVGSGAAFGPEKVLAVVPGPHMVEIFGNGSALVRQKVLIGTGSTKTIELK